MDVPEFSVGSGQGRLCRHNFFAKPSRTACKRYLRNFNMSRNGTASLYHFGYSPAPYCFSDVLEAILDVTGSRYGFLGGLRYGAKGQGCIMAPRLVVMRAHATHYQLDRFEQSPVFPHSEDLFFRAIMARSVQILKRPEPILGRYGLLPHGNELVEGNLVVVPTNVDCTPRGLLGLIFPYGLDIRASLSASRELVTRCGMLMEAFELGFA